MGKGAVINFELLPNTHDDEFKKLLMMNKDYFDRWFNNSQLYRLPNNTIWSPEKTVEEAEKDLLSVFKDFKSLNEEIELDKYVILSPSPWKAKAGTSPT